MKNIFLTSAAIATMAAATPASAATFIFSGDGFLEGATINGMFEAEDLDMDGQISSFQGEVTDITASFSGNSLVGPLTFTFADLFGLVWDMDAILGDGTGGDIEGLGLINGFGELNVGPGPFALCDGIQNCSSVADANGSDFSIQGLRVAMINPVPEPATWAFMIVGFGAIGGAMRRRKRTSVNVSYA